MVLRKTQEAAQKAEARTLEVTREQEERKIVQAAADVVARLARALTALRDGDLESARALLEEAKGLIEELRKEHDELQALPVQVQVYQVVNVNDVETARALLEQAKKALEEGNLPLARVLLNRLRNEIVVLTDLVPLDVLDRTLELARSFLEHGNVTGAVSALALLDTAMERVQTIIPRTLLEAYYLVDEIRRLTTREDKDVILELLDLVRQKVELSRVLGYVRDTAVLDDLLAQVREIEAAVRAEKEQQEELAKLQEAVEKAREKEEVPEAEPVEA